ncbi:MAG TPA: cytidine deaminase [Pseudonocardiaceae bacterium]|nr:cytidine deaminase [Pseudonocardiaceae bacterium]
MPDTLPGPDTLAAEDAKIVTLARSARARTGAAEGAAVRDTDGRTYAACTVSLPSLRLTALQAAIAAAVSSGAEGLEAAAVVTDAGTADPDSVAAVRDLGASAPVFVANPAATQVRTLS